MCSRSRIVALVFLGLSLVAEARPVSAVGPLVSGQLVVQGSRLTVYADEQTNDADQVVDVGERARIRTCFGGVEEPCGAVLAGDPRIAGLVARAELSGPEVTQPISLEALPGGTFVLPGLQQEGDYRLENIRLVEVASGRVLGAAEPSIALVRVREIVLTSATVRTLTLAELQARGIEIGQGSFQAFDFAVGFAFGSEIIEIELPLLYNGFEPLQPLDEARVSLDGLPEHVVRMLRRWKPPRIMPFVLEAAEEERPRLTEEENVAFSAPLFGAMVLPGSVSYLNQFFDAQLIVANGAPVGSNVQLTDLGGSIRLPTGGDLRVVASDPSVAAGQRVPVIQASGARGLDPGEQGSAAWTVEGLAAGTHTIAIDVTGQIVRPGREPLPVLSRTQAAVEVVDARFNLTFSHPDVVREGEAYSLFVTVTNLSRAAQNLITIDLDEQSITGTHRQDPSDPLTRTIDTLAPGQAETLEYRFVSELTGKVVATTFQSSSSAGQGTIRLRTGVGELGIPLSPATLLLPRFTDRLDEPYLPSGEFLRAQVRFLGLAHSLAVAPSGQVPPELPSVIPSDVERRAIDLGQAGHRRFLGERLLETLEILALDQLGNRHALAGIDELRRSSSKGEAMAVELAALFRAQQSERGLDALELLDHLAQTASYTTPWLAAVVLPDGIDPTPALEIERTTPAGIGRLAGVAGGGASLRSLPYGELLPVSRTPSGGESTPLAVVGHVEPSEVFHMVLRNEGGAVAAGRLVVVLPDDGDPRDFRRVDLGRIEVPAGGAVAVDAGISIADPAYGGFAAYHVSTGAPAGGAASARPVDRPPFRLVGSAQDFRLKEWGPDLYGNMYRPNRHGNGLVYLFNRPPDPELLSADAFRVRSTFTGLDTGGQPASTVSEKHGTAAFVQDDPRVVAVRYSKAVSPLIDPATGTPLLDHEHLLDTFALVDAWGESADPAVPPPILETDPLHVGGLIEGKVVRGTGEPAEGAEVELIRIWLKETKNGTTSILDLAGTTTTGPDGAFVFDFVEEPHWDTRTAAGYRLRATVPEGDDPELEPADEQEVGSRIRLQNRLARINIALLGRGTITGTLVYQDDGSPVPDGSVIATSTLFADERRAAVAADGSFRIGGVAVGPITLTGSDSSGRRIYATVGIEEPGATVDVRLEIPRAAPALGTVTGRVVRLGDGDPVAGAVVQASHNGYGVASVVTDAFGRFYLEDLPAGQITLQAAAWEVSRSSAVSSLSLAAGETQDVTLRLADSDTRAVTGRVLFHDPITNTDLPVEGAIAFVNGPRVFAYTDADGRYRIEDVPVQGETDAGYAVQAIDYDRGLQGSVVLPPILDVTADVVEAQPIVLERMSGGIDGVVLDSLGRPLPNAHVRLYTELIQTTTGFDGSFSFDDVRVGEHLLIAHVGDGLQPGRVGYLTDFETRVVYGGHRPFVTLRMRGSGVVTLHTTTATATGILTPIYYKPTWFHEASWRIKLKGSYIETTTDPNGDLELELPVGPYEIIAYNPFHGIETITGEVDYAGQTQHHEIVFEDAATVAGQVVDVDGHTPVPDIEVTLTTEFLEPQTLRTDAQGRFRFELVPKGRLSVTAAGLVGSVERVGRTMGQVTLGGEELDLLVRMKAQGTVRGRVVENFNSELRPLPFAQYYVRESGFPHRRMPQEGTFFVTDAEGRYQVSHLYAGDVTVVARDSSQVSRRGTARGTIATDWEVVDLPDVVLSTSVGALEVVVRDPQTGGPVADAQVRLSELEWTVSGPDGSVRFDALALGTYSIYAFHAPTGRSGRISGLSLSSPGQNLAATVYLDQRGEVRGTLYDDASLSVGVPAGIVELTGQTAGGRLQALATTGSAQGEEGSFSFLGIPEGDFHLEAAVQTSSRRARAEAGITETSPVADVVMVLEPVADLYVRLYESLTAGVSPVDLASGLFSARILQDGYDFTRGDPEPGTDVFRFPDILVSRPADLHGEEHAGERRSVRVRLHDVTNPTIEGAGDAGDPFRLVLGPRGAVGVTVIDGTGAAVPDANVTLNAAGTLFPSVSGSDGRVAFTAVPAGALVASATSPTTGTGGTARGTLTYDDEVVELTVQLAPAVAAHGTIFEPVADDRPLGSPSERVPAAGIIVEIRDARSETQLVLTGADGGYRFPVLPTGGYTLTARDQNGDRFGSVAGTLVGPDGYDNPIPDLVLDASPPRIVSIVPPPGLEGVSRTAPVEVVFSEAIDPAVLPTGQATSPYFRLGAADGTAALGAWTSSLDGQGFQVVRFTPSQPYENFTTYSLSVKGGPAGVRDRVGRRLTASGDVGSNFKTSDGIGPQVIATEPSLDLPVEPGQPIRFDFNEAVEGSDERFDGDGVDDAVVLHGLDADGVWVRLPVTLFLTRSGYSVEMRPVGGLALDGDTLRRRVTVSGLTDGYGNEMPVYERTYRLFDANAPVVDAVPYPDNAPAGELTQGVDYRLVPVLSSLDDVTPERPGGDLARVEYYFEDPTDPTRQVAPSYQAFAHPFSFDFVGAYSGDGVAPRPFPVWVRAVDTSANASNVALVEMVVLPNAPPSVGAVTAEAIAPVAGSFYAGSTLRATVSGLDDADGSQLTLSVELRADGVADALADPPDRALVRPASGDWADLPPQSFDLDLPLDVAEGTPLYVLARAIDSQGADATLESERHPVADDATPAHVDDLVAKLENGGPEPVFFLAERFFFEVRADDEETAVDQVSVTVDRTDLFPEAPVVTPVEGVAGLYRTSLLTVPVDGVSEQMPVVATVTVLDRGGNEAQRTLTFAVAPEPDPTAPTGEWRVPWSGAPWPAGYDSVASPDGAALLLRVEAQDLVEDATGELLPGNLVSVTFRGPWRNPDTGAIEIAPESVAGVLVAGTEAPGRGTYEALWHVPDGVPAGVELPFEVRLVDGGGTETVERLRMVAVPARRVYEGVVTAIAPEDPMMAPEGDADGAVFLLDGSTVSLRPQEDGTVRRLPALHLYTGGQQGADTLTVAPSVLTAPEVTTLDSAILFHPLELAVDEGLSVGFGSRVDMTERGLLGNTATRSAVLPGETAAEPWAGGSHGGRGGSGSPSGGWQGVALHEPGSVYDHLREPSLPGGGGTGSTETPGGIGGGVILLDAGGALLRLDGDVVADGGSGSGGGGAGGAVRLIADRLEGAGRVTADGGAGSSRTRSGGGGGGRVSVSYRELATGVDLAAQISAAGGVNDAQTPSAAERRGGPGTLFVEVLDAAGAPSGPAMLTVAGPATPPAAITPLPALGEGALAAVDAAARRVVLDVARVRGDLTGESLVLEDQDGALLGSFPIDSQERVPDAGAPGGARIHLTVLDPAAELPAAEAEIAAARTVRFHGRTRLGAVAAAGGVRLVADDSLLLGPAGAAALDDRAHVALADGARALLRGEGPEVTFTATPAQGTELLLGSSVELSWQADDPIGLVETATTWSLDGSGETTAHAGEPSSVAGGPATLSIPIDSPPGEVTYRVTATDLAGRSAAAAATWTVLPNEAPVVTAELASSATTPAAAGYPFDVVVRAADREGLSSVTLLASGPVTEASQTVTITGNEVETVFTIEVAATADGSDPVVLQAVAEDVSGASTTSDVLSVPVEANPLPTGTLALAPDAADRVKPGEATAVVVQASDPDGVATIELQVSGPATEPVQSRTVEGAAVEETFTVAATAEAELGSVLSVQATITDQLGASFTTPAVEISVVGDTDAPVVTLTFTPDAGVYSPGDVVEVTASATDDVAVESLSLSVAGDELSSDGSPLAYTWTIPPVSEATTFAVTAEATDPTGNLGSASRDVTVEPLADDVPPAVEFVCPTSGAVLPLGYELTLSARATDDLGVAWVDFYLGDATEPFARSMPASGAPAVFDATTTFTLPASPGALRFRAEVVDSGNNRTETESAVSAVATVDLAADGAGTNDWTVLAGQTAVLRSGTLTLDRPVALGGLIVLPGATVGRLSSLAPEEPLSLDVAGPVYVACGGAIDASGQGYTAGSTYPGHEVPSSNHGGSHIGRGGGDSGDTFGSVYRPREAGGAGWSGGRGGGVIEIDGDRVQIDGAVRANGGAANRGGAGGSIRVRGTVLAGGGSVEARSGSSCCGYGSGGGGAIALESTTVDPDAAPLDDVSAASSTAGADGGPGSVYRLGPSSVHGSLRLVNGGGDEGRTVLPSLGAGAAQAGSGGAVLVTGLAGAVPPYFQGHWVEVTDGSTGAPKGAARIDAIDGSTLTLDDDLGLLPGDLWQGVYRFDSLELGANMVLSSDDPVRVSGETTIVSGVVRTDRLESGILRVATGATLTHHASTAGDIQGLELVVGELVVEEGAVIEGSRLGFPSSTSYPGHAASVSNAGGSHLGLGGGGGAGETFGSVYRPREPGGGGWSGVRGGGVVRVEAQRVRIDGTIRVDGGSANRGSAGGSVWISTSEIAGTGTVEASGGDACCGYGTGGGGAIAIEYATVEAGSTLLDSLHAPTWNSQTRGGAGSVYLRRADQAYGDLLLDNGGATGTTVLPALGGGVAQAGTGGTILVTDRAKAVPPYFVGHWVDLFDGTTGTFTGTARIVEIGGDGTTVTLDADLGIVPGDAWQGVYRFDGLEMTAGVILQSDDPVRVTGEQVIASGTVRTDRIEAGSLRIAAGATVTHYATTDSAQPESLTIVVDELVVEAGGVIDASELGFASSSSYPGHTVSGSGAGGSHIGRGGGSAGETFGSVYRPREPGGGGNSGVRGGGVVRIDADRVQIDGSILANGGSANRGSAGGSIWITTSSLAGTGTLEASGGDACCGYGTGGGGAIAIQYEVLEAGSDLLDHLRARTWNGDTRGGAGSVLIDGPTEAVGDLLVDNGGAAGTTVLPPLGAGTAGLGSAGATLATGRAEPIPPYFVGHWVEVYDGATTGPKGAARIAAIAADGTSVVLDTDLAIAEGDLWQGVYVFDDVTLTGGVTLVSDDPIRMTGTARVAAGEVTTREVVADRLVVEAGARLVHPATVDPAAPESLTIDVRELVVETGSAIDASALGFPSSTSYPGHTVSGSGAGGSHMGLGGGSAGESFGSVYRPQEPGGGGNSGVRGGGVVRVMAERVQIDGDIRANGGAANRGSAGGSIWITTSSVAGSGGIEANGGDACCSYGTGGGGAIALRYETLEPGATVLASLEARTWDGDTRGGAGTVLVDGPTESFGDLTVDNGPPAGTTVLPALGAGSAQDGSAGATLVTDRASAIPEYFVGHWVEVYDGATAAFEGAARIVAIAPDGVTATLDADLGLEAGDGWQGVYRFDDVTLHGGVRLESDDPIRMAGEARIAGGDVHVDEVRADRLVVEPGARLRHFATVDPAAPESLAIDVRELVVEVGGAIDVSALGFASSTTYPGRTVSGSGAGGSHLGLGGGNAGETFGSVHRPREPGAGGNSAARGGGVVRIVADEVRIDGEVRADGGSANRGSAGGSVWITTGPIAGTGSVSASGGDACCGYGTGGGGAIAVEYQSIEAGATILDALIATTWDGDTRGGAGTVVVSGPDSLHGDLTIDNAGASGAATDLPSLGAGVAQTGSGGDIVVTDRLEAIPEYFVGHWVRVETPERLIKGTWRIAAVEGPAFELAPNGTETIDVAEGDEWYGLYRFDSVAVTGNAVLQSADPIEESLSAPISAALAQGNGDAPAWSPEGVTVTAGPEPGSVRVHLAPWAVADGDGVSEIRLGDGDRWVSAPWSPAEGVTLEWNGTAGAGLSLVAFDDHPVIREATHLVLTTRSGRPRPGVREK